MLSSETKRHIDGARQVLVGIVPDPKGQVDQITNALIYKFMDDMDQSAIRAGGNPSFFVKDLEKYSWTQLMSSQLGNQDRMNLYVEAIAKFGEAKQLPELFRDIFRRAFLPYRDPETLGLFLKEISYFSYSHSEELGNAYEYLLSILGSQGDAGQFRTPRHIIDFMVAVVDPSKDDTVLDPACGTAGFLISAYKHILAKHDGKNNETGKATKKEKALTPDERRRVMEHFTGYDISPDMVRMSQVNMYLHAFRKPKIYEYNTLASEDRWNEKFDVMLANPPFMSPQGGVRPHSKFSVESSRAEVLFVDYIMTHLKPRGRGGIIVPEGVIFQSGGAYKKLRKLLIEDGLYAVVSLPSGVFNPYSGVKTSILFFDNQCAPKSESVLFVDIQNTGIDLGATKKEIEGSDLPEALRILHAHKNAVLDGKNPPKSPIAFTVRRSVIEKTSDYNFSGNRYRVTHQVSKKNAEAPFVALSEISQIERGKSSSTKTPVGPYPLVLTAEESKTSSSFDFEGDAVCVPLISATGHGKANLKRVHRISGKFALANLLAAVFPKKDILNIDYLYWILMGGLDRLAALMSGAANVSMKVDDLEVFKIPLPSMEIQRQVAFELNGYQKVLRGAYEVINNWNPAITDIQANWTEKTIGEVCTLMTGGTPSRANAEYWENGSIPWLASGDVNQEIITECEGRITEKGLENSNARYLPVNSVLMALNGQGKTRGTVALLKMKATCNQSLVAITPKDESALDPEFLFYQLKGLYSQIRSITGDNERSGLNMPIINNIKIYVPDIKTQKDIVAHIVVERDLVESNKKIIKLYESKVNNKLIDIWNK